MFERILCATAAVATIAGFILEVWREMKSNVLTDDEGRKKKGRSSPTQLIHSYLRRPCFLGASN